MSIAETVYDEVKKLPEPQAREVLNFVRHLRDGRDGDEWRDLMTAQSTSLENVWDNPEDEIWNNV